MKTKKNVSSKRLALLKDLEAVLGSQTGADMPRAERILDAIEKTYSAPASGVPRLALWDPYLLLTHLQFEESARQSDRDGMEGPNIAWLHDQEAEPTVSRIAVRG